MTYESVTRKIQQLVESQWSNVTPMGMPNEVETFSDPDYFGRLSILPVSGSQVAVGGKMHRRRGVVIIQLFARQGLGLSGLGSLEEKAVQIFTGYPIAGIEFQETGADRIGQDGKGYYQSNVSSAFNFDVT